MIERGRKKHEGCGPQRRRAGIFRPWRPAICALGAACWLASCHKKEAHRPPSATRVEAVAASWQRLPDELQLPATVAARAQVLVRPQVEGTVEAICFVEGQKVRQGQVLVRLVDGPQRIARDQAAAQVARDRARLKLAQLSAQRQHRLSSQNLVAAEALDRAEADLADARGQLAFDEAQLRRAQLQLAWTEVRAPFAGVAGLRLVDPGAWVSAGDPQGLVALTAQDPVAVWVGVPSAAVGRLQAAMAAGTVHALVDDGQALPEFGSLAATDSQLQADTGTWRAKIFVPNAGGRLLPNQFVRVRLVLGPGDQAVVVPARALMVRDADDASVFVVDSQNKVVRRAVRVTQTGYGRPIGPLLPQFADAAVSSLQAQRPAAAAGPMGGAPAADAPPAGPPASGAGSQALGRDDAAAAADANAAADALVSAVQGLRVGEQVVTVGQHLLVPGAVVQVGPPPP